MENAIPLPAVNTEPPGWLFGIGGFTVAMLLVSIAAVEVGKRTDLLSLVLS